MSGWRALAFPTEYVLKLEKKKNAVVAAAAALQAHTAIGKFTHTNKNAVT